MKKGKDGSKEGPPAATIERKGRYEVQEAELEDQSEQSKQALNNSALNRLNDMRASITQNNQDRAAARAALRKLLFQKREGEFLYRSPGELDGKDFKIEYAKDS